MVFGLLQLKFWSQTIKQSRWIQDAFEKLMSFERMFSGPIQQQPTLNPQQGDQDQLISTMRSASYAEVDTLQSSASRSSHCSFQLLCIFFGNWRIWSLQVKMVVPQLRSRRNWFGFKNSRSSRSLQTETSDRPWKFCSTKNYIEVRKGGAEPLELKIENIALLQLRTSLSHAPRNWKVPEGLNFQFTQWCAVLT